MTSTLTEAPTDTDHGDRYCGGPLRHRDGTCEQPAGWGTTHVGVGRCKLHGGATYSHTVAAQRVLAERAMTTLGIGFPVEVEATDALLGELYRSQGVVEWLDGVVGELGFQEVTWGTTEVTAQVGEADAEGAGTFVKEVHGAGINVWVKLWTEQRAHLVRVAREVTRAGVEERRARVEEQQIVLLAAAMKAMIEDPEVGLPLDVQAKLRQVGAKHMRAISTQSVLCTPEGDAMPAEGDRLSTEGAQPCAPEGDSG